MVLGPAHVMLKATAAVNAPGFCAFDLPLLL